MSSDGTEKEEVTMQGLPQEPVSVEEGDGYSRVVKRVVLRSDTEQSEVRPPGAPGPALWMGDRALSGHDAAARAWQSPP